VEPVEEHSQIVVLRETIDELKRGRILGDSKRPLELAPRGVRFRNARLRGRGP
jgi:hypothetical protein